VALVSVDRASRLLRRPGAFQRLFTRDELAYGERRPRGGQTLAARLAAKLAARSALTQAGFARPALRDLEVVHEENGAPGLRLHGRRGVAAPMRLAVSLAHDRGLALASVWLLRDTEGP
jgi:holo-[acyl-carrier protein] synthase